MEFLKFVGLMVALILFIASVLGFSLLKIYDEIKKAIATNNRTRLWLSFSSVILLLISIVIGFSGVGSSIGKNRSLTFRIPLEHTPQDPEERCKND